LIILTTKSNDTTSKPTKFSGSTVIDFEEHVRLIMNYADNKGISELLESGVVAPPIPVAPLQPPLLAQQPVPIEVNATADEREAWKLNNQLCAQVQRDYQVEVAAFNCLTDERKRMKTLNAQARALLCDTFFDKDIKQVETHTNASERLAALRMLYTTNRLAGNAGQQWMARWSKLGLSDALDASEIVEFVDETVLMVENHDRIYSTDGD
ncbi:hypothetical protein HDU67_003693, partial [Dinochytrium kinnereticum]